MKTVEIEYKGVKLEVEGTYGAGEQQISYQSSGDGYPGSSSEYNVEAIYVGIGTNVYNLFSWQDLDRISELCIEEIEK